MNSEAPGPSSAGSNAADATPQQMLDVATAQQHRVTSQLSAFVPKLTLVWGVVWTLGFGTLWLIDGIPNGLALPVAISIAVALLVIGTAVSIALQLQPRRGMRTFTASAFTGTVYGLTWVVGSVAISVFAAGLRANGMSSSLANIYYPVAFVLFAGIMYIIAGAIWQALVSLILGAWVVVVGLVAPFFGYPTHYLILALGGGLGMLVGAAVQFGQLSRPRRDARATPPGTADSGGHRA